jgi:hypothetical protein
MNIYLIHVSGCVWQSVSQRNRSHVNQPFLEKYRLKERKNSFILPLVVLEVDHYQGNSLDDFSNSNRQI